MVESVLAYLTVVSQGIVVLIVALAMVIGSVSVVEGLVEWVRGFFRG